MELQKSNGGLLSERNASPNNYLIKIESFSLLSKAPVKKYTSDNFEAAGYKWKLVLYPKGRKRDRRCISIYLQLVETSSLPTSWEINISLNIFVFNHITDKYIILQDARVRRYHAMKTMWGIDDCMELETFSNPLNGYLIKDTCVFGAEVFFVENNFKKDFLLSVSGGKELVTQSSFKGECLSMMTEPITYNYTYEVPNYSLSDHQVYKSESFGFYKWQILVHATGTKEGNCKGNFLSIYLSCLWASIPQNTKLFVKCILRVKGKESCKDVQKKATMLLAPTTIPIWGFNKFMPLPTLMDSNNGYLVDNTCTIQAEVTLLGLVLNEW